MRGEQPDAGELLEAARESLMETVLPCLEGDARYQALMIANAMAIAARETGGRAALDARELELLDSLYGEDEPHREGEEPASRAARLTARLAKDLRNGELDGGPQLGVRRLLRECLEGRLSVSNPRRLARLGGRRSRAPGGKT